MKNKMLLVTISLILLVVLVGGTLIYNKFSDSYLADREMTVVKDDGKASDKNNDDNVEDDKNDEAANNEPQQNKNLAPDVEIFDVDGSERKLSDFFGKPVVLNFWATWCGPCKSEMPGFDNLYKKYGDKVHFLMVNCSEEKQTVLDFIDENSYSFPVYFDKTGIAAYTYGASSIPLTIVIDSSGELYGYQIGVLPEEALENVLVTLLEEDK